MKRCLWVGVVAWLLAVPGYGQSLTGVWQGVEAEAGDPRNWPAVLRLQKRAGNEVFGVLYQEVGGRPGVSATFQMQGTRTATGLQLDHGRLLNETGRTPNSYWCTGAITFTYNAQLEKLTGRATYRPDGDCDAGTFTLYRIKLKSAATQPAGVESTVRVSGRNVLWFADAELKRPLATGNTYRTTLRKTTTFYLKQDFYPTDQSPVVPITIAVGGTPPRTAPAPVRPAPAARPNIVRPAAPLLAPAPVVLPTVLFRIGTTDLLPEAGPALDQLAIELKQRPDVRLRVLGHTDRMGEPGKNLLLSEQRAAAVKDYLVKTGVVAGRISAVGYGDARPLHPSPDARNRRVEVEAIK